MKKMKHQNRITCSWPLVSSAVLLLVTFSLVLTSWTTAQADSTGDDLEVYGRIDSFPAGLIGIWVVDGISYQANGNTEFEQDEGQFSIGKCVKIDYLGTASPFTIREIETENDSDCNGGATRTPDASSTPGGSETPDASATPNATMTPDDDRDDDDRDDDDRDDDDRDDDDRDDDDREVTGIVEQLPSPGFIGNWVINGVSYTANARTEFEQDDGPFVVGACVEIEYFTSSTPFLIDEIETKDSGDCRANATSTPDASGTPSPSATPGASSTPSSEIEIYGRVESLPAGLVGNWVVNGVTYSATAGAEFDEDHGAFAVGSCVKIHANPATSPAQIREIETERAFRCGSQSGDDDDDSEIFGVLQSFPANLVGNWNVGGMTFVADASTEFKQENGAFAAGTTIKIHFTVVNGVNRAREIETKFENDDDGDDDDDNGSFEGAEGHAYSRIERFPSGLTGQWVIGGIEYLATSATEFEQDDGTFAVGALVKVEYYLDANGQHIAQEIETTDDNGGSSDDGHYKLYGFVNQMPPESLSGTWLIDNIAMVTANNTQFSEVNGIFAIGTFVEVEYLVSSGRNQIHEIKTHVPPGAGDHTAIGKINSRDGVQAAQVAEDTWVIGGRSYTVTAATDFNKSRGAIGVGETVTVNSYTASDNSEIATQIRGITLNNTVMVPLIVR